MAQAPTTASELADLIERVNHRLKLAERHRPLVEGREVYIRAKDLPEILSALRQVELMKGALEPFAEIADEYDDREDDNFQVWIDAGPHLVNGVGDKFRLVNFRRARQALTGEAQ